MHSTYAYPRFTYRRHTDQDARQPAHHAVIVVGAGPVGLTAALDLARRGVDCVLLDDEDTVSGGSRAICFAKRTLEIWDRLGCGQAMVDKGVTWNVGKVFFRSGPLYEFNLLEEAAHRRPAFINLQQYYVEQFLVEHLQAQAGADARWRHRVVGVVQRTDHVQVAVATPDGPYRLTCEYLIAADGAGSPVREMLGLEAQGQVFRDRFLIADVVMKADFPTERWFWFDPPFHSGQSTLLHKQPDNLWRIDFQLGWDADPIAEKRPENVLPRVQAMLGAGVEFELEWASVYTFACRRMERFVHGRIVFAGDSAHQVSPFGARGANGGVQDVDNLVWKLDHVLRGEAGAGLLDSYDAERLQAADENILNSSRSTDFITPKSAQSRAFRDATLALAGTCEFARRLVNSGRLSVPSVLRDSPLSSPDPEAFATSVRPGSPAVDAPVSGPRGGWLLAHLGDDFTCLHRAGADRAADAAQRAQLSIQHPRLRVRTVGEGPDDCKPRGRYLEERYDLQPGTWYLFRPDQHVCARGRALDTRRLSVALARAGGTRSPLGS